MKPSRHAVAAVALLLILPAALSPHAATGRARPAAPHPKLTPWGDPDFRATWTMDRVAAAAIPLERPVAQGDRLWLTGAEFAERLEQATKSDASYQEDLDAKGTVSLARWVRSTPFARRTSLIVDPANGRLPPMTPQGEALFKAGRNSWVDKQPIDWVSDLDSYDRCISRGVASAILPWPNNNGVRIFQSPGFVALQLEVLGTRVIPLDMDGDRSSMPRSWSGASRGRWEGQTLVIETSRIVAGDSVSGDHLRRAGSPITGRGHGTVPMGPRAHTVERLTRTGPNTLSYRVTYTDPEVFTAPWTAEVEWNRDDTYQMYEYACHEGNRVREWITASRAQRKKDERVGRPPDLR